MNAATITVDPLDARMVGARTLRALAPLVLAAGRPDLLARLSELSDTACEPHDDCETPFYATAALRPSGALHVTARCACGRSVIALGRVTPDAARLIRELHA